MTNEEKFVNELIGYIFAYPDDDYMTMECLCRKLVKHGLIDKVDGYYQTHEIRTDTHECVKDTHDKTESNSEKPNICEHITEDGVTCARYPACDDCHSNPLNKVKGSERLLKGKTEPTISKMEQVDKDDAYFLELMGAVERGEMSDAGANQAYVEYISKRVEESDTPQTERKSCKLELFDDDGVYIEPQTERSE